MIMTNCEVGYAKWQSGGASLQVSDAKWQSGGASMPVNDASWTKIGTECTGWKEQETLIREVLCDFMNKENKMQEGQTAGICRPPPYPCLSPRMTPHGFFDPYAARRDFPILSRKVEGKDLVWLDNGATTQKPKQVINRLCHFYENENSNVHRGAHTLAARATEVYENARETVRRFINAKYDEEIVFTKGTTESINLIAAGYGRQALSEGDEVIVSQMEHHANIVPWQVVCKERKAVLRVLPVTDEGDIDMNSLRDMLCSRTKIVAVTQVSNVLGTVTPAADIIEAARRHGTKVIVDGAQSIPHMPVDVQELDCDFFVFSGHKMYGPTGIGVMYAKQEILEQMIPWQTGGNMIADVSFENTVYQPPPRRFEAGTGNIADAAGLAAAIDYVESIGMHSIREYETGLLAYAEEEMSRLNHVKIIGKPGRRAGVLSFTVDGVTDSEAGLRLSREGIAVRTGHHCAMPLLRRMGRQSAVRASFSLYNTPEEIDFLIKNLKRL